MAAFNGTTGNDLYTFNAGDDPIDLLAGTDTVQFGQTDADLSTTTLLNAEILKALLTNTTFTVDPGDLVSNGSILGTNSDDTLIITGTAFNVSSTTLSSVEILKAGNVAATTFTVDQADLATSGAGGSVLGSSGSDTLVANGTLLNLQSTTLSSVEILAAGKSTATTFVLNTNSLFATDLATNGSVLGSSGNDTLQTSDTLMDLRSTTLSSVEILKGTTAGTNFLIDQADLNAGGSVLGSSGNDQIAIAGNSLDLTGTTLSSVERLVAAVSGQTTFVVDQADLASGGSVVGQTAAGTDGNDTLAIAGTSLNLTSTTLSSVEILKANNAGATTFIVDQADLATSGGSVLGSSGNDTLQANGTTLNLASTTLSSVEILKAGNATATTITVDQADLFNGGSVVGNSGSDTLAAAGVALDLSSTTLSGVEKIAAANVAATTFTVDQADLVSGGSVLGSSGTDTLIINGTSYNLTSTSLSSVENLKTAATNTTFTVDQADLISGGSVTGSGGSDTLAANGTLLDLSSTTLSSVETLKATKSTTTFIVNGNAGSSDLASSGSVVGSSGTDTLQAADTTLDLRSTTLSSVEILKAGNAGATTFTVDQADLASGGSVVGSSGTDLLVAAGTELNLSSTTLSSVEILKATQALTKFTVDQADLISGGQINGTVGNDTLVANGTSLNLASTSASGIEILQAGKSSATIFTVNQSDLTSGGSVLGSSGTDTLAAADASLNLSNITLSSVEILKAGTTSATTFTVDQADLASGGSVIGQASAGTNGVDTLVINGNSLNLTGTTLSSVEILAAGKTGQTTFIVDQLDLASGGSVIGQTAVGTDGNDTLQINGTSLNLSSTTLSSVEILKAGTTGATTFIVNGNAGSSDLASGGSVLGSSGTDTLQAADTTLNLSSTTLSSVEILKAGNAAATTFVVNGNAGASDLASNGSVVGNSGTDTLQAADTTLDLRSTTLSSVEKLVAGNIAATTFTVDQADLASGGSVIGSSGSDLLVAAGTQLNLGSTTLSSIEKIVAGNAADTTFTVDQGDLASGGSVLGSTGSDTLAANGTLLDLSSTALSSVEKLVATKSGTTFVVNSAVASDLAINGSVLGSSGTDTLAFADTAGSLASTTLSSVEKLVMNNAAATILSVDQADLAAGGSVIGNSGSDTLSLSSGSALDLSSTTLSSVETLTTTTGATTFTVDQADLVSGGSVTGSNGTDTLAANGTALNLTSTTLTNVEILKATKAATTFTVDANDLASGGQVIGSAGNDSLIVIGNTLDLSNTALSSVEILKGTSSNDTTFTVDQNDLATGGSIMGSTGTDTLITKSTELNLTSTTLSSIEVLKAGNVAATTFTVDQADLATSGGSVLGSSGSDTLQTGGTALNLTSTTLSSVEKLATTNSTGTAFTIDQADINALTSIAGSNGADSLVVLSSIIDLSAKNLSSVETLKAGLNIATVFTVDQADLASGGSVIGSSGTDTLVAAGATLNLSSTGLSSIEILKAGSTNATTFTVDQADLASGGSVVGQTSAGTDGNDTLAASGTLLDLTSTVLSSVEKLATINTSGTTFKLDANDLAAVSSIAGSNGADTLIVTVTDFNVVGKSLTSIDKLQAGAAGTTFTVDDPTDFPSIAGTTGNDTLLTASTDFDLSATNLSSVEILKAGNVAATTFKVDQADLNTGGSVLGSSGNDILLAVGTQLNLSSTMLSSVEILKAGNVAATTFTVDQLDLASGGSVIGSSGNDTLAANGTLLNLSSTTLSSVEILQATKSATTFIVDQADLASAGGGGSVVGSSGNDTLMAFGTTLNLSSTALTSVEILKAGNSDPTLFTVNSATNTDLASGGSVIGSTSNDTLQTADTALNLTSTTLSSVEILKAGNVAATTFMVDQADLGNGGSVLGSSGNDTLLVFGTLLNLTSTTLSSVEILSAGKSTATTFIVNSAVNSDLASNGSVLGSSGTDTLQTADTALNLSSTNLSSVEILKAGTSGATTFTVDQLDLAAGGSVIGSSGNDLLLVAGASVDLRSTTLSSVEILKASTTDATTFTVDQADLVSGGSVIGQNSAGTDGNDTLIINGTSLNLASTTLSSVEILKAGNAGATTFIVDQADLATSGGSVLGSSGNDTLQANGTTLNLASTTLSSVEILKAGNATATTITVDQADLFNGGSVLGNSGSDTLAAAGVALDLSSTTLSSVEKIAAANVAATTFTVDQADLASGGSVLGSSGNDTLIINGTSYNLASTSLSSVEILKTAGNGTTFLVDQLDLANGGSVLGSGGTDTLAANGTLLDLSSTILSSVEILKATKSTTTFIVNTAANSDLASNGSVLGSSGNDTLQTADTALDLRSTTLSSVEILKAGTNSATTFTVDQADLVSTGGSVIGSSANDTLVINGTSLNLTSTTLSSVEILKAGNVAATTFTVDQADLASGGSVIGSSGNDTLLANGTLLNLSSTTLSSVETLQAGKSAATTFIVNGNAGVSDLASNGSVVGSSGNDTLQTADTTLNLSSTTLSSVEILKAGATGQTTFTVNQADLASGGSVIGQASAGTNGNDTLVIAGTSLDLRSTTLSSVDILKAGTTDQTTFTVDQADLASGGTVQGQTSAGTDGNDTLQINGTSLNLASTTLSSVEILKAGNAGATTFIVDQADLATSGGSVLGSSGNDTLQANGTTLNLASTTLSSVEILKAGNATATTITVDQADLFNGGSVLGNSGSDTLAAAGVALDLSSTTLSSVEKIAAANVAATTFTVDQADLASGGSVLGSSGNDTLIINGTSYNLTSTTLSSVEILKTAASGTTFLVDQADLASAGGGGSVLGSGGTDTLAANGTLLDLSSTILSSVEILKATKSTTTFIVNTAANSDLASNGSVLGSSGNDTLQTADTALDLRSTTLSSVEILKAGTNSATTFTVDQADLVSTGGSVIGSSANDTLTLATGSTLNLSSTTLTSVEILATTTGATTFVVDQADLASAGAGGTVSGSAGNDTLQINGTSLNLTSTVLTSVEILAAGKSAATTFIVNGNAGASDLASNGSVLGSSGTDTLQTADTTLNLSSTTLSSVEILKAGTAGATTFTVNQADLASGGSVIGSTANDTLVSAAGSELNLSSTTLSSVEILTTTTGATTFTVDQADLASGGSVVGSAGNDTLAAAGSLLNLTSTTLSSVEILRAGTTAATTFIVNTTVNSDLASNGSVIGSSGNDTLQTADTALNLTSTTLSSVEILKAGTTGATTFTVNQLDLASSGSVIGSSANDTLVLATGSELNLSSTTLSSVEILTTLTGATTFTVDQTDLASGGSVIGSAGNDTLAAASSQLDLRSTTLSSVEILKAGTAVATTFIVNTTTNSDLASGGSVVGSSGNDTLQTADTALDLRSTTLSSVEILKAGSSLATTFTLDKADLTNVTSIVGSSGIDTIVAAGTELDLSNTTLTAIEKITGGNTNTTYTLSGDNVDQLAANAGAAIAGGTGTHDILVATNNANFSNVAVTGIEEYIAAGNLAFTFNQADLTVGGSVTGSSAGDFVVINAAEASLDLTSTTLTNIDLLGSSVNNTTWTITGDQLADLGAGTGVQGTGGVNSQLDTLVVTTTDFDLSSTGISFVEILKTTATNTTFTLDQADLNDLADEAGALGGQILGSGGTDTLFVNGNTINLSSTTLSSVEIIKTSNATASTTFTVSNGERGALVDLTVNGKSDTIDLAAAYKLGALSTDDAVMTKQMVAVEDFLDGTANLDIIDVSHVANGTVSGFSDITGFINLANPATLKDALDIAAVANGSTQSSVVTFQYAGDTYVLVDKSATNVVTTDDAVIKLVGTHTLTNGNFDFTP